MAFIAVVFAVVWSVQLALYACIYRWVQGYWPWD